MYLEFSTLTILFRIGFEYFEKNSIKYLNFMLVSFKLMKFIGTFIVSVRLVALCLNALTLIQLTRLQFLYFFKKI